MRAISLSSTFAHPLNLPQFLTRFISPGHFHIQLPGHPTFQHLPRMQECMDHTYQQTAVPGVEVAQGLLCAAPYQDGWHRVAVSKGR